MTLSRKDLGRLIKEARQNKSLLMGQKYTQAMLAKDVDISRSYLGDIESGRKYPNYVLLSKIAECCGVPMRFFDEKDEGFQSTVPTNPDIRRIARAGEKLTKEQAETLRKVAQSLFPEAFDDGDS